MERLLTPCVVKYKDTAVKTYLHLNAFLNSVRSGWTGMGFTYFSLHEREVRSAPYITISLSSPIDSSFLWLFFNIGGVSDLSSIPTEDNTIHFDTPRLSPAFVIAGVDKREKIIQPKVTTETSDRIWETMTFHQKLSVWGHIKALGVKEESSLIAYWFRELFSATDVGNSPLWGSEIIKEILSTIPTHHHPMPRIRKNRPITSTRIDKLCPFLAVPLSMTAIVGKFDTITKEWKWVRDDYGRRYALVQIDDVTEMWPVERLSNAAMVELSIEGKEDPETGHESSNFDMMIMYEEERWTILNRAGSERVRRTVIPPPIFFIPTVGWENIPRLYLEERFTLSMDEGGTPIDDLRFQHYQGETTFFVGSENNRNGYLYTMMSLSPTVRAIVEMETGEGKSSMTVMTERTISPYFSILWDYMSMGKNAFTEDVYIPEPEDDESFSKYLTLWKDISYFGIPVNTPFVEGYLKAVLSAVYRYLLNDDSTIQIIVAMLKEIPRDVFLRVNAPIIHTSEYLKQGKLGYIDLVLSSIFKPYIPHIVTTYPYSTYKIIPRGEATEGDIVVFWNRAGRSERSSTTHKITHIHPDGDIDCLIRNNDKYRFSPNNSYTILVRGNEDSYPSKHRITGITILRSPREMVVESPYT